MGASSVVFLFLVFLAFTEIDFVVGRRSASETCRNRYERCMEKRGFRRDEPSEEYCNEMIRRRYSCTRNRNMGGRDSEEYERSNEYEYEYGGDQDGGRRGTSDSESSKEGSSGSGLLGPVMDTIQGAGGTIGGLAGGLAG